MTTERWSRGCGSGGVGYSGGTTEYGASALVANWVEDRVGAELSASGKHWLVTSQQPELTSTYRKSFTEQGKTGGDLLEVSQRLDTALDKQGLAKDILLRHGDMGQAPTHCLATTYQLVHGEKHIGEPHTQQYLWQGNKHNDRAVPLSTTTLSLTAKKAQKWQEESASVYQTTSQAAAVTAALAAAQNGSGKRSTLRPGDGGSDHTATVGRKPTGIFKEELDKTYHKIGLRCE